MKPRASIPKQSKLPMPITPFPTLFEDADEAWQWPVPPFAWRHRPAPADANGQPCRLETGSGIAIEGQMMSFDPVAGILSFRTAAAGPVASLAFTRFRRLTLTIPLQPALPVAGAPVERVPAAAQEREYRLHPSGRGEPLTGRTAGHVETVHGMYLFTPVDEEASLRRVFVPRSAYARAEFGPSAEEVVASRWFASPGPLLEAIAQQQRMPVRQLGHSLLELGLLTQAQLDRALNRQSKDKPLGESLVAAGMISRADLQTALAHKMGYPVVDLARFPIDPAAVAKLPHRIAAQHRVMPILLDKERLIVAVDKPSRVTKLRAIQAYADANVVAVLAPRVQIILALERIGGDVWSQHVGHNQGFFSTTL